MLSFVVLLPFLRCFHLLAARSDVHADLSIAPFLYLRSLI